MNNDVQIVKQLTAKEWLVLNSGTLIIMLCTGEDKDGNVWKYNQDVYIFNGAFQDNEPYNFKLLKGVADGSDNS